MIVFTTVWWTFLEVTLIALNSAGLPRLFYLSLLVLLKAQQSFAVNAADLKPVTAEISWPSTPTTHISSCQLLMLTVGLLSWTTLKSGQRLIISIVASQLKL